MSQQDDRSGRPDAELDRIDGLVSAAMDDELGPESREELRRLVAEDESVAARVRSFHRVDAGLRQLGSGPEMNARLDANFASLSERLDWDRAASGRRLTWLRSRVLPALVAAAAALAFYLAVSASSPVPEQGFSPNDAIAEAPGILEGEAAALDAEIEEGWVWALGYIDDPSAPDMLSAPLMEDFEIIDQLELLDFLSDRDEVNQGREGRG